MGREISGGGAKKKVVQRAVAVAPDYYEVGAALFSDLHYLFPWAAHTNYQLPCNACSAHESEDLLPDLRLLLFQGFDQQRIAAARSHQGRAWEMANINDHHLGSDSGRQVRHLLETFNAGRRPVCGHDDLLDPGGTE
jgi:hypothetical protein